MEQDKITLPMDVSKGIQFDFTVEGITADQADKLLGLIMDEINNYQGAFVGGGFVSVAHMEDIEKERGMDWEQFEPDLLDMVDDDISLDDIEEWEDSDPYWDEELQDYI